MAFPSRTDTPILPSNFSQGAWLKILQRAGIEPGGPNQSRHTNTTITVDSNVSLRHVAGVLGHVNVKMAQEAYGSTRGVPMEDKAKATAAFAAAIAKAAS